jgi:hypothetical protein
MIYLDLKATKNIMKRKGLETDSSDEYMFDKQEMTNEKVKILNKTIRSMSEIIIKLEKEF